MKVPTFFSSTVIREIQSHTDYVPQVLAHFQRVSNSITLSVRAWTCVCTVQTQMTDLKYSTHRYLLTSCPRSLMLMSVHVFVKIFSTYFLYFDFICLIIDNWYLILAKLIWMYCFFTRVLNRKVEILMWLRHLILFSSLMKDVKNYFECWPFLKIWIKLCWWWLKAAV